MSNFDKLYSPRIISEIKKNYDFELSKSLGQNFLTDKNIIDKIVGSVDAKSGDLVIEIGPGIGVITRELLVRARKVVVIELDNRLIPILRDTLGEFDNLEIINSDVLKTDINEIIRRVKKQDGTLRVKIVGNLPYYITTPIIMKLLEEGTECESITIMMQREVAERLMAREREKQRAAISVAVQYYADVFKVADVKRDVFIPPPNVDSKVLRLDIKKERKAMPKDEKIFFNVVKAGFMQRRKTLLNSLSKGLSKDKEAIRSVLQKAQIDEKRRAETLSIKEFANIADEIVKLG